MGFSEERNGLCVRDDLISRKAVIQAVDKHTTEDGRLDDDISVILEEIPTAYDVDAVCVELRENAINEISERNKHNLWIKDTSKWNLHNEKCSAYHKAMEIVRNGGIKS